MRGLIGGLVAVALMFSAAVQSAAKATPISLQKRSTGTYYVHGALQGYGNLEMLVDTGSSLLAINETILARLKKSGTAHYSHKLSGFMADGTQRQVSVYRISALRVGDNCWVHDVEAAIFPPGSRVILGINVLSKLAPFTFSADPPQLLLNQCTGARTAARQSGKQATFSAVQQ